MAMTLITTNTESNAASSSFTSGIDSTYKLYIFTLIDINPATDNVHFQFQCNVASGSGYNETITSVAFLAGHYEDDSSTTLAISAGNDLAQGTGYQNVAANIGNGADESVAGTLWLFNPSNTTYVKHFYSRCNQVNEANGTFDQHRAGFFNVTAAITNIQFKMSSGNFDGTIKLYGVG